MTELISSYGRVVQQLRGVSRGRYPGPAVTETVLDHAFTSIGGLDTDALRHSAQLAAGDTETAGVQGWLGPLIKFLGSVGAGMVVSELMEKVQDWVENRGKAKEVAEAADRAADAIDLTVQESDGGIEAILMQLAEIISQISQHLATIDPEKQSELFMTTVQAGADIIDDAAAMVLGLCADRDRAIEDCYCALIDHGNRVCGQPDPTVAPAVSAPQSGGAGSDNGTGSAPGGAGGSGAGTAAPPVTTPASVAPTEEGLRGSQPVTPTEPAPGETATENRDRGDKVGDCQEDIKEDPSPSDCDPDTPGTSEPAGEGASGEDQPGSGAFAAGDGQGLLLGALGAGLLAAGVGLIIDFLEQAVQEMVAGAAPEMPVELPTEIPAEIAAEIPIEAAEQIQPETAPPSDPAAKIPAPATSTTPEAELHLVPEPAPKPQPTAVPAAATDHTTPLMSSPESPQVVQQTPVVSVPGTPATPGPPGPPGPPESQARIHKAGGW